MKKADETNLLEILGLVCLRFSFLPFLLLQKDSGVGVGGGGG